MTSLAFLFVCACFATLAALATVDAAPPAYVLDDAEVYFEHFIEEYARDYMDEHEEHARFLIFKDNLEKAIRMNEQSDHATFGITRFMDLTSEEFVNTFNCLRIPGSNLTGSQVLGSQVPHVDAPDSFDWRQHKAVTGVKSQETCGGCYAFSATGNIEGQYAIKYQQLVELSEQQIIDCDTGSYGCNGGYMTSAFASIIRYGGIESESSYPFVSRQQACHFEHLKGVLRLKGYSSYLITSQAKMKEILYSVGPISIGVKATAFQAYQGGIMSDAFCNVGSVNHAVLLVGYGTDNGEDFWLVKNSWATSWGEDGYFRMHRGEGADSCGMMEQNGLMASAIIE